MCTVREHTLARKKPAESLTRSAAQMPRETAETALARDMQELKHAAKRKKRK